MLSLAQATKPNSNPWKTRSDHNLSSSVCRAVKRWKPPPPQPSQRYPSPSENTAPVNGYHSAILCGEIKNATRLHFKFDHRSFIVKHEHNQSICTKRLLLQITWLPPRGRAQQLDFLADVGMEGRWDPQILMFTGPAWSSSSVSSWSCTWNLTEK